MREALTKLEQQDGAATLALDRSAKRNALSRALCHEVFARLAALETDDGVHAVILTGAGPVFCAGFARSGVRGRCDGRGLRRGIKRQFLTHQPGLFES